MTTYISIFTVIYLYKFSPTALYYEEQLKKRLNETDRIYSSLNNASFNPSVVVGWDASSRGRGARSLSEVSGKYPFTPIVVDSTPEKYGKALNKIHAYQLNHLDPHERLINIFSWNELGNGASLLPQVLPDGRIDYSYIKATRKFFEEKKKDNTS